MKKITVILMSLALVFSFGFGALANNGLKNEAEYAIQPKTDIDVNAKSALLMEAGTGEILAAQNQNERAALASVTKIMTLLLVMEAIEDGRISVSDRIIISDYAASMGGSQVFLEEGESMDVEELVKCAVIASANDAAVALAEHVGGSEKNFVSMMNARARELKMENTNFENVTGLDDTAKNHYSSALDIGIMSRELIKYDLIKKYSSLWQDTIRNGEFTLTNTNRLVRYYDGCNGLKTGSTDKAGYCISATAERDGMTLIAVIMGAESRDVRNSEARGLLDYGFSNYAVYSAEEKALENVPVHNGIKEYTTVYSKAFSRIIPKNKLKNVEAIYEIPKNVSAPIKSGDVVGKVTYKLDGSILGTTDIFVAEDIAKIKYFEVFSKIIQSIFMG